MLRLRMCKEAQEIENEVAEKLCSMLVACPDFDVLESKRSKRPREDERNGRYPDKRHQN